MHEDILEIKLVLGNNKLKFNTVEEMVVMYGSIYEDIMNCVKYDINIDEALEFMEVCKEYFPSIGITNF
jgi:hypothetical protein